MRLTDISIRALKPPPAGAVIFPDDTVPGFGVRVSQAGTKSFILTHGRTRTRETIGRVGILRLQEAREEAKRLLAEYTLGKKKTRSVAWDTASQEYLSEIRANRKPRTHADYERLLGRFKFGATRMDELTQDAVVKRLDKLRETPAEYIHAFVVLRAFFNWSYRHRYLEENPLARMTVGQYNERERILSDEEIRKVWHAAEGTYGRIVKLLITTGQRRGEISAYEPEWKNADTVTWPAWLTKNSRIHTFPIGPLTESLLGPTKWKGWSKAKVQLDKKAGVYGWTLHDLRRTLRTKWAQLGIPKEIAKKYINHITGEDSKLDKIYDRHTYLPEMRAAVATWEAHLQRLLQN